LAAAIYILAEKISVQQLNDEAIFLNSPFFENIYETYKKLLKKSTIDSN
jgi:predicted component of type VI protein secretion system